MNRWVVDASVAIKWFLPETYSEAAHRLLKNDLELLAPDLLFAEVGNVLWKRQRRGELEADEAGALLREVRRFPVRTYASAVLLETAWRIATRHDRTVYDSLYVALAVQTDSHCVTADRHLVNALQGSSLASRLCWIEDIA